MEAVIVHPYRNEDSVKPTLNLGMDELFNPVYIWFYYPLNAHFTRPIPLFYYNPMEYHAITF